MKEKKNQEKMGVGKSMWYTLKTIWRADKGCIIFSFYKNISEEVYMSFFFILMLQMIYSICIHLASATHAYYIRLKIPQVYGHVFNRVIDKATRIELTRYEQPDFYDKFAKALDECLTKAMDGLADLTWVSPDGSHCLR